MQDYEYLFSTELYKKLKEKIKGRVFVKIKHDKLYVEITRNTDPTYEYVMNNMAEHILNGLSTSYLEYSILKDYRKFVNKQYFK